jgi:hypothetical protein
LADRFDGFSLELIIPVHLPDPIPKYQTAKVEIIIAQFPAICSGKFAFFSQQVICDHPAQRSR